MQQQQIAPANANLASNMPEANGDQPPRPLVDY